MVPGEGPVLDPASLFRSGSQTAGPDLEPALGCISLSAQETAMAVDGVTAARAGRTKS